MAEDVRADDARTNPFPADDLRGEMNAGDAEPLLPIEKKLIAYSLGLGLVLLVVLAVVNRLV